MTHLNPLAKIKTLNYHQVKVKNISTAILNNIPQELRTTQQDAHYNVPQKQIELMIANDLWNVARLDHIDYIKNDNNQIIVNVVFKDEESGKTGLFTCMI